MNHNEDQNNDKNTSERKRGESGERSFADKVIFYGSTMLSVFAVGFIGFFAFSLWSNKPNVEFNKSARTSNFVKVDIQGISRKLAELPSANPSVDGQKMILALQKASKECQCVILTSGAIIMDENNSIPDYTGKIENLMGLATDNTTIKKQE